MTIAPISRPVFQGPRHLTGGAWRRALELAAVLGALSPFIAWCFPVGVAFYYGRPDVGLAVLFGVTMCFLIWTPGWRYVCWARRRVTYWWDMRACGLALNAERGLTASDTGTVDLAHTVVVPILRRLEVLPTGFRYVIRPLPGQALVDFEAAVPRLTMRFGAAAVTVDYRLGTRLVAIEVATRIPPVTTYRRAA